MALTSPCASSRSFETSIYAGFNIQEMLYGVELALYLQTMHAILGNTRRRRPQDKLFAIYSTVILLLATVWLITQVYFGARLWVLRSIILCGLTLRNTTWYFACGSVAIIGLHLMTDALMVYRCWMTWDIRSIMLLPLFLWIVSLVLGILSAWSNITHEGDLVIGVASKLGLAYYTVTMFLNMLLAGMICYRVIRFGRTLRTHFGRESGSLYFAVAALVIESMLPYTLSGIAFLISLGIGSSTSSAYLSAHVMLTCLSSQILIFRVHTKQLSKEKKQPISTIEFVAQTYVCQCPGDRMGITEIV